MQIEESFADPHYEMIVPSQCSDQFVEPTEITLHDLRVILFGIQNIHEASVVQNYVLRLPKQNSEDSSMDMKLFKSLGLPVKQSVLKLSLKKHFS